MAMIDDVDYILHAIRLSTLRTSSDPLTSRILSISPNFSLNPYINASGLSDLDRWPELKSALDSPPPEPDDSFETERRAGGLKYTTTIMGGKSGGLGMRVNGRSGRRGGNGRANSSSGVKPDLSGGQGLPKLDDGFFSPVGGENGKGRPRLDSAPVHGLLAVGGGAGITAMGSSMLTTGRGLGVDGVMGSSVLEQALSGSEYASDENVWRDAEDEGEGEGEGEGEESSMGLVTAEGGTDSVMPSDLGLTVEGDIPGEEGLVDEGSDVDEEEMAAESAMGPRPDGMTRTKQELEESRRSSAATYADVHLDFKPITVIAQPKISNISALTAALNKHVPHLVSTSSSSSNHNASIGTLNPFASLYASVSAPAGLPSIELEIYFPHSSKPSKPLVLKVRKDATVEEATGYGLYKYWEEGRDPKLSEEDDGQGMADRWSTIGWGLRIVEDDGEVDEDFPPLDRDSQISKFSYGQFAIVEATESQIRQNTAKAPHIQRRPSRIIAVPVNPRLAPPSNTSSRPGFAKPASSLGVTSASLSSSALLGEESSALKGSVGLSSALSKPVLLRVKVTASADVHFTTTISVPSDMYIADLTDVLCKKKRLQSPSSDWVLCLADLTLALPLDRTVASLEGRTDLALVRRQWAVEQGLRIDDRRGGDPSASIFKRVSEPVAAGKYAAGLVDLAQTYKKYTVQRKIAIGRHERVLTIDGDYIHIMPSESRAFFDSMKTTSFHITLIASCKLTGRAGGFKINVWREGGQKRYEFDAENGRQAAEIISLIRQLMRTIQSERANSMGPPRRVVR